MSTFDVFLAVIAANAVFATFAWLFLRGVFRCAGREKFFSIAAPVMIAGSALIFVFLSDGPSGKGTTPTAQQKELLSKYAPKE